MCHLYKCSKPEKGVLYMSKDARTDSLMKKNKN